jgi:hypothetical protein
MQPSASHHLIHGATEHQRFDIHRLQQCIADERDIHLANYLDRAGLLQDRVVDVEMMGHR